jgi:site-specific DNA-methyltransferase (adenine-specific)
VVSEPSLETAFGELYDTGAIELIERLAETETTVQLLFADPPYNIGKADWDRFDTEAAYLEWVVEWVRKAGPLLSEAGSLFVMGFSEGLAEIKHRLARECEWYDSLRWLVWSYRNKPLMSDRGFARSHESVLWLRKSDTYTFHMDRVRVPYNDHTEAYPVREQGQTSLFGSEDGYTWDPDVEGAKPRDVIDVPTVNNASSERTDHPTQKPEELLRKLVWATTDHEDRVLDPFGGSGTTYAVCEQLGRRWVGTEPNPDYREMIADRLADIEHREDPDYWMKHDLDRREHRRKTRYGSE